MRNKKTEMINLITADRTNRPKELYFCPHAFFVFGSRTLHTLSSPTSHRTYQRLPKSAILLPLYLVNLKFKIICAYRKFNNFLATDIRIKIKNKKIS